MRVQPGARSEAVTGWDGAVLHLRVAAPARQGRANAAVVRLVAHLLGVAPSAVALHHGAAGRLKVLEVAGVTEEELRRRLRPYQRHSGVTDEPEYEERH